MKHYLLLLLPVLTAIASHHAARAQSPAGMMRIYEDNDWLNLQGKATDEAYSNGTRLDWYYPGSKLLKSVVYELMPKAGDSSQNTMGWSLMQIMITPSDISKTVPDAGDHHYSGSLFLIHSLHSVNAAKQLSLQSEWVLGVMGPPSLAGETQRLIHQLIGSQRPMGWAYQLPSDLLLNYNLTIEKGLLKRGGALEVVGGAQAFTGLMHTGAAAYTTIRMGRLLSRFSGFIPSPEAGKGRVYWYVLLQPNVELTLYNALLEGGFFLGPVATAESGKEPPVRRLATRCDFGFGLSFRHLSLSFTQKTMSSMIKGLPNHTVGNLSLVYAW